MFRQIFVLFIPICSAFFVPNVFFVAPEHMPSLSANHGINHGLWPVEHISSHAPPRHVTIGAAAIGTRQKDTPSHDKNDEEKHTVTRQKTHHRKTKKHTDTRAKDHVTMARGKSSHDVFHEEEEPLILEQPLTALNGTWPYILPVLYLNVTRNRGR